MAQVKVNMTLRGDKIAEEFQDLVFSYVKNRYGEKAA